MSNTAERIAQLRKKILSAKGKIKRRRAAIEELRQQESDLNREIQMNRNEIREMGGKVRS